MKYSLTNSNGFRIITIPNPLSMLSNIDFLKAKVAEMLQEGQKHIALKLAEASYLSSHSIAVLISCNELILNAEGEFMVVGGGEELEHYLSTLGLRERFSFCRPTEDLARILG